MKFLALALIIGVCFAAADTELTYNMNQVKQFTFASHEYLSAITVDVKIPNYLSQEITEEQLKLNVLTIADPTVMTFDYTTWNKEKRAKIVVAGTISGTNDYGCLVCFNAKKRSKLSKGDKGVGNCWNKAMYEAGADVDIAYKSTLFGTMEVTKSSETISFASTNGWENMAVKKLGTDDTITAATETDFLFFTKVTKTGFTLWGKDGNTKDLGLKVGMNNLICTGGSWQEDWKEDGKAEVTRTSDIDITDWALTEAQRVNLGGIVWNSNANTFGWAAAFAGLGAVFYLI